MNLVIVLGGLAVATVIVAIVLRRRSQPIDNFGEDLFEGLLPSAATGHPEDRPPAPEAWELRWADVTNLSGADSVRRRKKSRPAEESAETVEVEVPVREAGP